MIKQAVTALMMLTASISALAEVTQAGAGGFTSSNRQSTTAKPAEVYQLMTAGIAGWWDADHTWSSNSENLYLDASAGGCLCEKLPDGGWVEHLRIIYLAPGQEIRFSGALGPLMQMGLQGTMIWMVEASDSGSVVTWTYSVSGNLEGGFESLAPAVDGVMSGQLERLVKQLKSD